MCSLTLSYAVTPFSLDFSTPSVATHPTTCIFLLLPLHLAIPGVARPHTHYVYCWKALYVSRLFSCILLYALHPFLISNLLSFNLACLSNLFVLEKYKIILGSFSLTKKKLGSQNFSYDGPLNCQRKCGVCMSEKIATSLTATISSVSSPVLSRRELKLSR